MSLANKIKTCIAAGIVTAGLAGCGNDNTAQHESKREVEYTLPADCKRVINVDYIQHGGNIAVAYENNEGKVVLKYYFTGITDDSLTCAKTYTFSPAQPERNR